MFVRHQQRHLGVLLDHRDMVTIQRPGVHAQGVVHQFTDLHRLQQAGGAGIGLLGGDNVLDVVHAFAQLRQLIGQPLLFEGNGLHQLVEVAGQQFAFFVLAQVSAQVVRVFVDQLHGLAQPQGLAGAQLARDQFGGDVHAVEHVADVVQHIGRDFCHARLAGVVQQFALGILEFPRARLDALFKAFIGPLQGAVDPVDLGKAAQQTNGQVQQQHHQQRGKHQQVAMVLLINQVGGGLVLIELGGQGIQLI